MAGQDKARAGKKQQGEANLGQKDAQQQQRSDAELNQMGEQNRQAENRKEKRQSE